MVKYLQDYVVEQVEKINARYNEIHIELYKLWRDYMFLTWRWWVCLAIFAVPLVIWLLFRDKKTTFSLLVSGLFMAVISFLLETIGMAFGLWSYQVKVFPVVPPYIPWDFSVIPVATMFFIQWKSKYNLFVKSIIFSLTASFIAQPLATMLEIYNPKHWPHYYSFPIFVVLYIIAHSLYHLAEKEKSR